MVMVAPGVVAVVAAVGALLNTGREGEGPESVAADVPAFEVEQHRMQHQSSDMRWRRLDCWWTAVHSALLQRGVTSDDSID